MIPLQSKTTYGNLEYHWGKHLRYESIWRAERSNIINPVEERIKLFSWTVLFARTFQKM